MPTLTVQSGAQEGKAFQFQDAIVIGRGDTSDLVLVDPSVSRRHAMLVWQHGLCHVQDLGSGNGTFVNDRLVSQPTRLNSGDLLRVGSVLLAFTDATPSSVRSDTQVRYVDAPGGAQVLLRVPAETGTRTPSDETMLGAARRVRFLEGLARISTMVFDERALMRFVVDEVFEMMPQAERAFVMLWDTELERFVSTEARTRSGRSAEIVASRTLLQEVLARREAVLVVDALADGRYAQAESIHALKLRSAACAPMLFQQEIYGVIQADAAAGAQFGRVEVALALGIASEAAMALAYARLHAKLVERELVEHDLALARRIQRHFLPARTPECAGYSFGVEYRPALAIGGDIYDFVELRNGVLGVAVGDVSGKGISAALYGAKVTSDLRYQSTGQTRAAVILERINCALTSGNAESMFVTLALAVINPVSGRLSVASAGHPLPLVRGIEGHAGPLGRAGGSPLGLDDQARFDQYEYEIDAGDCVVLYTDGVIEALNARKELFGSSRLEKAIERSDGTPDGTVRAIVDDVRAFAGSEPQSDDLTVVCFGRDR